ncbi:MAG: DUF2914 domain-containing protein [Candidatus Doudnabacteria bacterium]|nr:DUF2914 domain-containing protein [Candidatus Doudnabacteria bacterium]
MKQVVYFQYQKAKALYTKFERWLMPLTLLVGFVIDYLTFVSINVNTALWLLGAYLALLGFFIAFINLYDAGVLGSRLKWLRLYSPLALQFFFGGVLGNSFIFYWFSSSLYVSWPFIFLFVVLMVFNDVFRHEFLKLKYQIPFYCFLSFSVFSVVLPFALKSLNPYFFVLAGILALLYSLLFYWAIAVFTKPNKTTTFFAGIVSFVVFFTMNGLYFFNLVPPVPLVVRESLPAYGLERKNGTYVLKVEEQSLWQKLGWQKTMYVKTGERVYVFSAIYSPSNLNTKILHEWEYKDPKTKAWVAKDKLEFNLVGGRVEGFRGYSWKTNLNEGDWRVYIKTLRGQTVGRVDFTVKKSDKTPDLIELVK